MDEGTQTKEEGHGPEFVQSLDRGLAVIRVFGAERSAMTLSEVAREAGLSRASARRFLHTLLELGYVGTDGRAFSLRPKVLELGYAYLTSFDLPEVAQPHLEELSETVGESASVAVLDETDIVYVARVATHRIMSAAIRVGTRFPAYVTSMGRAILSHVPARDLDAYLGRVTLVPLTRHTVTDPSVLRARLAEARARGWALVDQELEEGLRSLAVPLHGADGAVVGAVNVAAPVRRGDVAAIAAELVPPLQAAARAIEADLARVAGR
ncbi:IclR family transcriptional regulator domain-containing protein [Myceligenerans pegani]|uniref:Helix-turn-helix domain-containing protein n=1 Tax=Myceligenerans pegani TaxID=2776917 RepID=A0ABR9N716_9MICO|nr:IclR family transcriptional regulator C-terminal domain-containing protein [Myceligenerans sp. TRM 65318]MBE1879006.1 helix-turn-helix domain-containing protein [Myceligenerans sp. TRM 65318]MBE3021277.1 helix-turn-helix domain-containing protein [Myceligenerans sp. TRM 65318]